MGNMFEFVNTLTRFYFSFIKSLQYKKCLQSIFVHVINCTPWRVCTCVPKPLMERDANSYIIVLLVSCNSGKTQISLICQIRRIKKQECFSFCCRLSFIDLLFFIYFCLSF